MLVNSWLTLSNCVAVFAICSELTRVVSDTPDVTPLPLSSALRRILNGWAALVCGAPAH